MLLKKVLFILLITLISFNCKPDSTTNHGSVKDIPVNKLVHDGEVTIKSDSDIWDVLAKVISPILALAAVALSWYTVKRQVNIAQKSIDERSIGKTIDALIFRTDIVYRLIFKIIAQTHNGSLSDKELLTMVEEISYNAASIRLYLPKVHKDADSITTLGKEVSKKASALYIAYTEDPNALKKQHIKTSLDELITAEKNLFGKIHNIIDEERNKQDHLLA